MLHWNAKQMCKRSKHNRSSPELELRLVIMRLLACKAWESRGPGLGLLPVPAREALPPLPGEPTDGVAQSFRTFAFYSCVD